MIDTVKMDNARLELLIRILDSQVIDHDIKEVAEKCLLKILEIEVTK